MNFKLALAAKKAYKVPPTISNKKLGVQVLIEDSIIACRGTDQMKDWAINLHTDLHEHEGVLVSAGILKCFLTIKHELRNAAFKVYPMRICGHSMGGALAQMIYQFMRDDLGIVECDTYGSPRVFASFQEDVILDGIVRYENPLDIVTWLPPSFSCYSHYGETRKLPSGFYHGMDGYYHAMKKRKYI